GQQVVNDQHALAFLDGVFVDLESVGAVFQGVVELGGGRGQLARLAQRNESGIQTIRDGGAENKSARLHSQHQVDPGLDVMFGKRIDQHGEAEPVLEQCGDVVK